MSKEGKFLIYCMERYRFAKNMTGRQVADFFERYKVADYIIKYFESMHTTSDECIISDIDELAKA